MSNIYDEYSSTPLGAAEEDIFELLIDQRALVEYGRCGRGAFSQYSFDL
jgi:hypothetical protein